MRYTKTEWKNNSIPYLDADNLNRMEEGIANSIRKDGSVAMEAELTLAGSPTNNLGATPKQYVDSNVVIVTANKITELTTEYKTVDSIETPKKYNFLTFYQSYGSDAYRPIIFNCNENVTLLSTDRYGSIHLRITEEGDIQMRATTPSAKSSYSDLNIICIPCQRISIN